MIPRYQFLCLSEGQIRDSIHLQVLAHYHPKMINWPPEPWQPISGLDLILYNIRNK